MTIAGQPLYLSQPWNSPDGNDALGSDQNRWWQDEVFGSVNSPRIDSPYGFNLFTPRPGRAMPQGTVDAHLDNPFTPAELERVMRPYDIDNRALAPRLACALESGACVKSKRWPVRSRPRVGMCRSRSLAVPRDYRKSFATAGQPRAFNITDLVMRAS